MDLRLPASYSEPYTGDVEDDAKLNILLAFKYLALSGQRTRQMLTVAFKYVWDPNWCVRRFALRVVCDIACEPEAKERVFKVACQSLYDTREEVRRHALK